MQDWNAEQWMVYLDTVTQFWSPDLRTELARVSCSLRLQVSMGVLLRFSLCWTPDMFNTHSTLVTQLLWSQNY